MQHRIHFRGFVPKLAALYVVFATAFFSNTVNAFQNNEEFWQVLPTGVTASLRGLELCDDGQAIWACGANSTVVRSPDLGKSWTNVSPSGFDKLEFRSIHAWNGNQALIASAGTPAVVLRTDDAGQTWKEVLRRTEEKAFFDALKFYDSKRGILFSDPVDDKWLILTTEDGGQTWKEVSANSLPKLQAGEAAFAASNSALCVGNSGQAWIGTGGVKSDQARVYRSANFGQTWQDSFIPIPSAEAAGIFSIVNSLSGRLVAVGGDYRGDAKSLHTAAYSDDQGRTWKLAEVEPSAFRSSVVVLLSQTTKSETWFTTGPGGTDASQDGAVWRSVSKVGFHVLDAHPNGTLVAVGSEGRFGIAKIK
jgi:photosystem II stability/assembly factor-like uncharacterized protein